MNEILVLAEHRQGKLQDITLEMLSGAEKLARLFGWRVTVLLCGDDVTSLTETLTDRADEVLTVSDSLLANYNADHYLSVLQSIIKNHQPILVILGHTATGLDLAPALATRLSIPLATDVTEIAYFVDRMDVQRQLYAGKINAHVTLKPSKQYVVSIRPGTFQAEQSLGKSGQLTNISPPEWTDLRGRVFRQYVEDMLEDIDISAAQILVSVGRGIEKQENIPIVQEFADTIGATLSCSRPVADKNWLPKSRQVGTSGKSVKPKVYIALGISGAFQHVAGMKNASTIIAVNKDPQAPIFNVAHYGIVADIFQILPILREKVSGSS